MSEQESTEETGNEDDVAKRSDVSWVDDFSDDDVEAQIEYDMWMLYRRISGR